MASGLAGSFFPADYDFAGAERSEGGQPWTATTWTLNTLREWGLDASALRERRTAELLDEHSRWDYDDSPYWSGVRWIAASTPGHWPMVYGWVRTSVASLTGFSSRQLPDGGWNCEWVNGSRRSSFYSTLNSLKGLLAFEATTGSTADTRAARHRGEEYLLERELIRRLTTNQPVAQWVNDFIYPIRWSYSALNACEYFRLPRCTMVPSRIPG